MTNEILSKRHNEEEIYNEEEEIYTENARNQNNALQYIRENLHINITNLYGEEVYKRTKIFEKLKLKQSKLLCDLTFLCRCRDSKIIPTCMKLSFHQHTSKIDRILTKASLALLRTSIQTTRKQLDDNAKELLQIHLILSNKLHPLLWQQIDQLAEFRAETDAVLRTTTHKNKFDNLMRKQKPQVQTEKQKLNVVHNISNQTLSTTANEVLEKGFNFAITPKHIPVENIICTIEPVISTLTENIAESIRQDVSHIIRNAKPPKQNITREQWIELKNLRNNKDIIILPADKGNATVVMNTIDYEQKIENLLDDPAYKRINTDPTTYLEKTTKAKIKSSPIDAETQKRIIPREKSSRCPKFYGLPKIHKQDVPLRPIVSCIDSPLQALARYLSQQLQPYATEATSYVKNSLHFLQLIKQHKLDENDLLVSFDITSLFTKVPIDETLQIIDQKYKLEGYLIKLIEHCLKNTYFMYKGQRYKQIEGAPMGSPLSPIIANLFMEDFETRAIDAAQFKPKLWLRYVDDTFVIWPHGKGKLNEFLNHLNCIHTNIKFTMEIEENGQLPFLDVLIKKNLDGTIGHTVYRKPTHTNRYLNAASHHHPAQLNSVIKTLIVRSQRLADNDHIESEMKIMKNALIANGFTENQIFRTIKKIEKPSSSNKDEQEVRKNVICLPYIKGTTDKISKLLRKHDVKVAYTVNQKISNLLRTAKDVIPLENRGVYELPCSSCPLVYVGQTNRRIQARIEEHKNAVRKRECTSSLFQHFLMTGHSINFDNARTIANVKKLRERLIREAVEIEKRPNLNKRNDSVRLPSSWKPLLKRTTVKNQIILPIPTPEQNNTAKDNVVTHTHYTRSRT